MRPVRTNPWTEWQADPSPDGKSIAFLSNRGGFESLWEEELASGKDRCLVRDSRRTILGNPHFSPDGSRIVCSSNALVGHQVFVAEVDSGRATRLKGLLAGGCEPRFCPDGRHVVHVTRGHHNPTSRLVETDLETGAERILVAWPALNYDPVSSPDQSEIAFASNISGEFQVYRLRLGDGRTWQVTSSKDPSRNPDYRPAKKEETVPSPPAPAP